VEFPNDSLTIDVRFAIPPFTMRTSEDIFPNG